MSYGFCGEILVVRPVAALLKGVSPSCGKFLGASACK